MAEEPTLKRKFFSCGDKSRDRCTPGRALRKLTSSTSGPTWFFPPSSLRLTASENMMVSREGEKETVISGSPFRDPSSDLPWCLIGKDPGHMPIPKSITGKRGMGLGKWFDGSG